MTIEPIAHIFNDFPTKFGLPRQSGMSQHLISRIVMEPPYRSPEAFRGLEAFDHLWLIWEFAPMGRREWSPTVRPPKLGGNKRMGVFATRSPNRPNPLGLTCVKLLGIEQSKTDGPVLTVSGADLMNGTAIFDIKPYLPFADSVPHAATGGYGPQQGELLEVVIPQKIATLFTAEQLQALREVLAYDPRPGYRCGETGQYGFSYAGYDVRFFVRDGVAEVIDAERHGENNAAESAHK